MPDLVAVTVTWKVRSSSRLRSVGRAVSGMVGLDGERHRRDRHAELDQFGILIRDGHLRHSAANRPPDGSELAIRRTRRATRGSRQSRDSRPPWVRSVHSGMAGEVCSSISGAWSAPQALSSTVATLPRKARGVTPSTAAADSTAPRRQRTLLVVSGVPLGLKKIRCSRSSGGDRGQTHAQHLGREGDGHRSGRLPRLGLRLCQGTAGTAQWRT